MKCPPSCAYAPKEDEQQSSPFPAFRADSNTEYQHLLKLYLDYWLHRPQSSLDGMSPAKAVEADPDKVLEWLSGFKYPVPFPMDQLLNKLGLPAQMKEPDQGPEAVAFAFLDDIISLEWLATIRNSVNYGADSELAQRYSELLSAIPETRKFKSYKVIHAGVADDGITALAFLEINNKLDWTIILNNLNGSWQVRQNLNGSPQLYYAQNDMHKRLAEALSSGKDGVAWEILQANLPLYPDSADLRYYLALYWQLVKQPDKAKVEYFNSIALDNNFYASAFTLGALYMQDNELKEALYWFEYLEKLHPDDLNVKNNIAACYAGAGETNKARAIWSAILSRDPSYELAHKNLERYSGK